MATIKKAGDNGCMVGLMREEYLAAMDLLGEFLQYAHNEWDEHGGSGDWCGNAHTPEEFVGQLITVQFIKMRDELMSDPAKLIDILKATPKAIREQFPFADLVKDECEADADPEEQPYVPSQSKGYDPMYF